MPPVICCLMDSALWVGFGYMLAGLGAVMLFVLGVELRRVTTRPDEQERRWRAVDEAAEEAWVARELRRLEERPVAARPEGEFPEIVAEVVDVVDVGTRGRGS